eukprot:5302106-Prorocentrum_lima.AAC.1
MASVRVLPSLLPTVTSIQSWMGGASACGGVPEGKGKGFSCPCLAGGRSLTPGQLNLGQRGKSLDAL